MTTATTITKSQAVQLTGITRIGAKVTEWLSEGLEENGATFRLLFTDIDKDIRVREGDPVTAPYTIVPDTDVSPDTGDVLGVSYSVKKITPKEIWDSKDQWWAQVEASQARWDDMSEEDRALTTKMVENAISLLSDNPELLPSLTVQSGVLVDWFIPLP